MTRKTTGLPIGTVVGYGAGDFGLNLFYTTLNLYLLYYYTDVVGLSPAVAGTIFMAALLWDAVTDPVMGLIASRTRSRHGQYRVYFLFAAPLLCLAFVAMFVAPLAWPAYAVSASAITHLLFRTAYTVVAVPYSALSAAMTRDSAARTSLSASRMQFATLAAVTAAFMTPWLAGFLGDQNLASGYAQTAVILAILAELALLTTFFKVREQGAPAPAALPITTSFRLLRHNRALWVLFAAAVCNLIGTTVFMKSIVYYARYVIGDASAVRDALTVFTIAAACAVLAWAKVAQLSSKSTVLLLGLGVNIAAYLSFFMLRVEAFEAFLALAALAGVGTAATVVAFWALLPDTVEYGELKSGIRDEGIIFGLYQFAQKAASGVGVGLVGFILSAIGYVANTEQPPEVLDGITRMNFLIPTLSAIVTSVLIWFYPLRGNRHDMIVKELENRRTQP